MTLSNGVQPPTEWATTPTLPNFADGNHFMYVRFSQPIDIDSVLNGTSAASVENNLRGTIDVLGVDPLLGTTTRVSGRAFIGGKTFGSVDPLDPGRLLLEDWVALDGDGKPAALDVNGLTPGVGFPGTEDDFSGSTELIDPRTFVFVADTDNDLSTHETFPAGLQIRMVMTREVRGVTGEPLREEGLASATVGPDDIAPEVAVSGQSQNPLIIPGNGDMDVDPATPVLVSFSEPIQIPMIGDFDDGSPASPGSAIQLTFGPSSQLTNVPFTVRPLSPLKPKG